MGLESATYIEDLNENNPLGTDSKAQGDNHLRLIKSVLKSQFPNLGSEAVTATAEDLNEIFENNRLVPTGAIMIWSGAIVDIPTGWSLCDGTLGTPNLINRFVAGTGTDTGGALDVGETGGSEDITLPASTEGHSLTAAEGPEHTHGVEVNRVGSDDRSGGVTGGTGEPQTPVDQTWVTTSSGNGTPHSHDIAPLPSGANLPPYYALAYIMKL